MVDIFIDLPDDLVAVFEFRARALGTTAEALMRGAIEAAAPQSTERTVISSLQDEPIVKAAEIESEALRLGYEMGWRFITCPQRNAESAKLLFVTLNPGGRQSRDRSWSHEAGSAYRVESWEGGEPGQNRLQKQVQAMFQFLGLRDEEVFSAYYVPFRSPSWNELPRRDEAEIFARGLWSWLLPKVSFDKVVCMGRGTAKAMITLTNARYEKSVRVNWGNVTAERYRLPDGRPLFALPHMSRYAIFGRTESRASLEELFYN